MSEELVTQDAAALDTATDFEAALRARDAAMKVARKIAFTMTRNHDWVAMGQSPDGKPLAYLQATGIERVGAALGITRTIIEGPVIEDSEDEGGKYYIVRYRVRVTTLSGSHSNEEDGFCSSRDKFFGTEKKKVGGVWVRKFKPLEKVDKTNICKKALTNAFVRAVSMMLGLRSVKIERLNELGIEPEGRAEFRSKKKAAAPAPKKDSPPARPKKPASSKGKPAAPRQEDMPELTDQDIPF